MVGDGQMSMGSMIVKPNAKKVRRIGKEDGIVTGFAGATADAMTLLDRLERKLEEFPGQLLRSCVELAKGWRTDKYLRRLEAMMIVADGACACLLKIIYAQKETNWSTLSRTELHTHTLSLLLPSSLLSPRHDDGDADGQRRRSRAA